MIPHALIAAAGMTELIAQVVTTIISFLLVVAVLWKFAWHPILDVLDARRKEISDNYDEIDRKLAEANSMIKDYEERIQRIDDEARERLNKAVDEGRQVAQSIVAEARNGAEEITQKAKDSMALELDKARIELRREVVEMTLHATGRLISANLDDAKHRQLVEKFVEEIGKQQAS